MGKELCKQKKLLKDDARSYMKLVSEPAYVCKKCGRAANRKKLVCSPTPLQL